MEQQNYGDSHAELYDVIYGTEASSTEIDALEKLAEGGRVLELGVGTGRIAIPLANRGLSVAGIDNSVEMLSKLSSKSGGDKVDVSIGTLPAIDVEGAFQLILCLDQTFLLITNQDSQIECLANAAAKLAPGGKLVLEIFASATPPENGVLLAHANDQATVLWAFTSDPLSQLFHNREIVFYGDRTKVMPFDGRGVSVAELDLMARLSGLTLSERWADWTGSGALDGAMSLISIYEATEAANTAK
ncbi:MAG: class I SAM-dependent DNA methyltransferase [Sulfitobacter sp.]